LDANCAVPVEDWTADALGEAEAIIGTEEEETVACIDRANKSA